MPTAFISHSTPDDRFVVELKGLIRSLGYEYVFNDSDYDSIKPDQELWPRIVEAIKAADALVVVISEESAASTWVNKEVEYARSLKKRVVPIWIDDCNVPELFQGRDVIDFRPGHRNPLRTNKGRTLREYLQRVSETLKSKHGVLTYLSRVGYVDDSKSHDIDDDEFGFSVLVEENRDSIPHSSDSSTSSTDASDCLMTLTEAVERHRAVVIIGEPGAGKSTTIRRMAQVMAANFDKSDGNGSVPILLDLTRWPKGKGLNEAIEDACLGIPDMTSTLQKMNHSVFLDGLNEVSDKETLGAVIRAINEASKRTGPLGLQHLIITCRNDDYLAENDDGTKLKDKLGLPSITIRDMDKEEIEAFCEGYLPTSSRDLIHIIQKNCLWELAGNAYMLCALIFIYQKLGAESFPTNKGDLFPRMIKALWTRETKRRGYSCQLTDLELTTRLGELAHWVTLEYGFGTFDLSLLPERLNPRRTVSALARRCGLLSGIGNHVRFNHQLTQEYFTAHWLKVTELNAATSGKRIDTADFRNSFRILGGMSAQNLGLKLFAIFPLSLAQWVVDGVYSPEAYTSLVTDLLKLRPSGDYWGDEYRALELVVQHDLTLSEPVLVEYLQRADSDIRTIVIALRTIQTPSTKAAQAARQLLNDLRGYTLYTRGHAATPSFAEYRVRDLAVDAIFRLGQDEVTDAAIEQLLGWLNDSRIVEHEHWADTHGYIQYSERLGNRAFTQLWNGPAVGNAKLRQVLVGWLETQEDADGVAAVTEYCYGCSIKEEVTQAAWARKIRFGSRTE